MPTPRDCCSGGWAQDPRGGVYHSAFSPNIWADPRLALAISFCDSLRSDWMRDIMITGEVDVDP